ncbi:putative baseplate assembly protein [Kineosporia sp. J2-2]|uniref:Baseplate assembly protein n=1 Tax=Kineosporia corallincola TaxID=2835133 RepID=A0ABS5TP56_9ACTN|nr:putative baseplate assembly protein [Kineosporia corallincola]MBT0772872.1 putative baseplate assembly protein [Kineosporia corallincola]
MGLPSPDLDDRHFQQFVDDAKRHIQRSNPDWTDHNVSDPGITLIEAVAHMADQVVYRLNRVPDKSYLAFLNLLGVRLFPPTAARADVTFWLSAPQPDAVTLPADTEVATQRTETDEALVFATERDLVVPPCSLERVGRIPAGRDPQNDASMIDLTGNVRAERDVPVFSKPPQADDALLFGLSTAVPGCAVMLALDSQVDGVGVDPRQPPLRWEAWTPEGWQECEIEDDGTGGLNRAGDVVIHVPAGHVAARIGGHEAGWLRCLVVAPFPDQPFFSTSPTIRSADAFTIGGTVAAVHAQAVRNEVLGESTGAPGQRVRVANVPVLAGDPPLLLEVAGDDGWQSWVVVDDFSASGPDDRHVTLEPATGEVTFGPAVREPDGSLRRYGAVPPRGSVIRAARYRAGGGRSGNVSRGTLQVLRSSIPFVARVENREAARGGVNGETVDEAAVRAPITLRAQDRAVTARDYEELAWRAAPETARIACVGMPSDDQNGYGENAVRILVVPQAVADRGGRLRFEQLVPGDRLLAKITGYLDERRPLGTRLAVGPPFYQGVSVRATLHSYRAAQAGQVRERALDALYDFLDPMTGGPDGTGWPFGRPLRSGDLFAALQRLPGVELVDEVLLYPSDPITRRRGEAVDALTLSPSSLFFSFEHDVDVIGPA